MWTRCAACHYIFPWLRRLACPRCARQLPTYDNLPQAPRGQGRSTAAPYRKGDRTHAVQPEDHT